MTAPPPQAPLATADPAFRRDLLRRMLRIRRIEERIAALYGEQEMRCPVHLSIGQEGCAVGVTAALGPDDYVMAGHRAHAPYLARGGDLKAMLAEIYGKATGYGGGKGGSMHPIDPAVGFLGATPIVGSTIPIAVGAALGAVMQGEARVSVVFFGDGAAETGVFHESLNIARLHDLPVIFVCENNLYSVLTGLEERQPPGRAIAALAAAHGMPAWQVDGNDVLAVFDAASEAVEGARGGTGPAFLELATYRWLEHCGPEDDDHLGYRPEGELETWKAHCPVVRLQASLLKSEALSVADLAAQEDQIDAEIDAAVDFAPESPPPDPATAFDHVYGTPP